MLFFFIPLFCLSLCVVINSWDKRKIFEVDKVAVVQPKDDKTSFWAKYRQRKIYAYHFLTLFVGISTVNGGVNNPTCGRSNYSVSQGKGASFFCRPSLPGRYVTIRSTLEGTAPLCEVEVYSARRGMLSELLLILMPDIHDHWSRYRYVTQSEVTQFCPKGLCYPCSLVLTKRIAASGKEVRDNCVLTMPVHAQ